MSNFKAKAGTIQLLGKGLIVDLPTAITELWKNGYDAYGDTLSCDLYTSSGPKTSNSLFIVSDDGVGMSRSELEEKWLTIGSTSKKKIANKNNDKKGAFGKEKRPSLGEKGIGQLSVAYLGSQMLMLTKKKGHPCEAMYFDWGIWDNLLLNLDDVDLTIKAVYNKEDFDLIFQELKNYFLKNLDDHRINWQGYEDLRARIKKNTEALQLPSFIADEVVSGLTDLHQDHGTKFITFNPEPDLLTLTENAKKANKPEVRFIKRRLSGLYNNFKKDDPPFEINFWIHEGKNKFDFVSDELFFNHEDFARADYYIGGQFDKNGHFTGTVKIFNLEQAYHLEIPGNLKPVCGPFTIELGYLLPHSEESGIKSNSFHDLNKKLDMFGGIYIYRDNFRILPYGLPEYDIFDINKRKEFNPEQNLFSLERFFGYIDISASENLGLRDKAGGEGLERNDAYSAFRQMVIHLLHNFESKFLKKKDSV